MTKKSPYVISTKIIPAKFKHEVANIIWSLLQHYEFAIDEEGNFRDGLGQIVKLNHVRLILRQDYMNTGRTDYAGAELNRMIDSILNGAMQATKATVARIKVFPDNAALLAAEGISRYEDRQNERL